jgi:hypothetical protein
MLLAFRRWLEKGGKMGARKKKVILKKYERYLPNGDRAIVEVIDVDDWKYEDGIMYTFRCISWKGETLFAVENSHGKPHVHLKGKKEGTNWNWKVAFQKFDQMLRERLREEGF